MDYPGSKLTYPIRLGLLIAFITAFFVISPIIIMYTAGYRYDWQNGLLKETGAISIDIEPTNAVVFLNDVKLSNKIPIRLKNIAPQKYKIKITAPGYFDWQKEVEVGNKQTVYIKEIVMLKKNIPQAIADGPVEQVFISPDQKNIIYTLLKDDGLEIWIRNLSDAENIKMADWTKMENIKVSWAENNNYFALSGETAPYSKILLMNTGNLTKQIDLAKKAKGAINKYSWKESIEPELFFSTKLKIMSYLPPSDRVLTLSKNNFADWYMENGQLWTIQINTSTNQYEITRDTLGFNSVFKIVDQKYKLLVAKNDNVLLSKEGTSEMTLIAHDKIYNIAGEKFIISKYNNWWLMWTPWELWSYTDGEQPTLLNRSGEQLREVIPLDKYNTLGLRWAEKMTALFPYYFVAHDMLNFSIKSAAADSDRRVLYFAGAVDGKEGLWELKY